MHSPTSRVATVLLLVAGIAHAHADASTPDPRDRQSILAMQGDYTVDFAFDEGQLLTEHSSPRAVVVTLLSGTMDFDIESTTHHLTPGDVLYMAPGAAHALRTTRRCHRQLGMVDVDACPGARPGGQRREP